MSNKTINAVITGVEGYLPEYVLDNFELSTMVDTSDEWIMTRIGIKERRILKDPTKASAFMGGEAVKGLLKKTNTLPEDIDLVICTTITPDMQFPATATLISEIAGIKNAFSFDLAAACSGFLFGLETANAYIKAGRYKKVIIVAAEKMSTITDYSDRNTCPLFGDAAAAVLVEPTTEEIGFMDSIQHSDGRGAEFLHMKGGGSLNPSSIETVTNKQHYLYQEGKAVFRYAVSSMADVSVEIIKRNNMSFSDIQWLVPHQANMRIIEAVARRMELNPEQVMMNIEKYGNTTSATIPLCLWNYEKQLKKGDNLVLSAFGGGFTWGSILLKWGYDSK